MKTIREEIMEFLLRNGSSSKSRICDYVADCLDENGKPKRTLGETTGRCLRLMVEAGILTKGNREFNGRIYPIYSVTPMDTVEIPESYKKAEEESIKEQELPL